MALPKQAKPIERLSISIYHTKNLVQPAIQNHTESNMPRCQGFYEQGDSWQWVGCVMRHYPNISPIEIKTVLQDSPQFEVKLYE